ncbi:major facilitator superfamily domain-containing protein [Apodospora peruviana]|uniref:Major facilitator superfamily domain-containing protein n=1 Tax=Apodospora peruviana TaxID=516989 RepID=A0AAE0HTM4_9PEZI|nr:major facilitator superfamily domain-containing protein [Apodospora peruviana]
MFDSEKTLNDSPASSQSPGADNQIWSSSDGNMMGQTGTNSPPLTATSEETKTYPKGWRLFFLIVALTLSNFLIALDQAIVATAVPKITDEFNAINDIGWYGSAYLLTVSCCQLLFGKFYTIFSIKWTFIIAILTFELGSLICAVAPSSTALIIGRAIAGLGGGGVFSGVYVITAHSVPVSRRPLFAGLDSATFGFGSVAGPLLGGVFTDKVTWRWCFYVNLPLGALSVFLVILSVANYRGTEARDNRGGWGKTIAVLDLPGLTSLLVAVVCLLLALQWGGTRYPWDAGRVIAILVLFTVLSVAFLALQWFLARDYKSLPSRQVATQRSVAAGCLFFLGWGAAFMSTVYFLPVWFQAIQGVSAFESGVRTIPLILGYAVASMLGGIAVTKLGYYTPFMLLASALMAVGAGLLTTLTPDSGAGAWIGYQAMFGIGLGFGADLPLVAVQTVLPLGQVASATGLLMFAQTLGATIFISVAQNVFARRLIIHLRRAFPGLDPLVVLDTGATKLRSVFDVDRNPAILTAYNKALNETFLVPTVMSSITMAGSLAMEWASVRDEPDARESSHAEGEAEHAL